jgi:hypothetical protein
MYDFVVALNRGPESLHATSTVVLGIKVALQFRRIEEGLYSADGRDGDYVITKKAESQQWATRYWAHQSALIVKASHETFEEAAQWCSDNDER